MKTLFSLSLVLTFAAYQVYCKDCHMRELDLCASTLLLFNQDDGIAQTEADLNKQCTYIREVYQCLKNYTINCMTQVQRELVGFFSEGSEKLMNDYCTPGSSIRNDYLKNAPCLNSANDENIKCLRDLQVALEVVGDAKFENRIPIACCAYRRYEACFQERLEKKCGKNAVEFIQELLRIAISRVPEIICTGYGRNNSECTTLLPSSGSSPKGSQSNSALSRLLSTYLATI
ncbi:uncharacterized protein LOC106468246 [Limulus polyphemus]|uniref:Uncharacterized protein LOC106468246 n=1 Tax=Limulus polyphemus TaxID=6850 RepID=A0ABM1BL13_LIMPO|nr:uncharacterized protein LOC106468246 [Limulus polyphemus]